MQLFSEPVGPVGGAGEGAALLSRREWLAFLAWLLLPRLGWAGEHSRLGTVYTVDAGVFFGWFRYRMDGLLEERIDRTAKTYTLVASGEGEGIANRIESSGVIRDGRFWPTTTRGLFRVRGRESRVTIDYDYDRSRAEYHHVSHTFLLGRRRTGDDVLTLRPGLKIDDLATASLNYAEGKMEVDAHGFHFTHIIRRARVETEGVDEVRPEGYRAQIVPLRFRVEPDQATGGPAALVDLTRFSSWASSARPARVLFDPDRRIQSIEAHLILGSRVRVVFVPERL
jgi:hypothetical protein